MSDTSNLKVNPGKNTERESRLALKNATTRSWRISHLPNYLTLESKTREEDPLGLSKNPTMFPIAKIV